MSISFVWLWSKGSWAPQKTSQVQNLTFSGYEVKNFFCCCWNPLGKVKGLCKILCQQSVNTSYWGHVHLTGWKAVAEFFDIHLSPKFRFQIDSSFSVRCVPAGTHILRPRTGAGIIFSTVPYRIWSIGRVDVFYFLCFICNITSVNTRYISLTFAWNTEFVGEYYMVDYERAWKLGAGTSRMFVALV